MSIIEPAKTPAQQAAVRIRQINEELLSALQDHLILGYDIFWKTAGVEPQAIADCFGDSSNQLLIFHAAFVTLVAQVCASSGRDLKVPTTIPTGYSYAADADGLPTGPLQLTYTPPVPPVIPPPPVDPVPQG